MKKATIAILIIGLTALVVVLFLKIDKLEDIAASTENEVNNSETSQSPQESGSSGASGVLLVDRLEEDQVNFLRLHKVSLIRLFYMLSYMRCFC